MSGGASAGAVRILGALLEARTGQQLAASRNWRIDTALRPLLAVHDLPDVDALVARLIAEPLSDLPDRIVDALLNQETSFFRDAGVIEAAARVVAAQASERGNARPRIWCAGCATGQEPLSLAMAFAELPEAEALRPEIIATDVSETALARGRAGRYTQFEIQRGLPVRRMMRWFDGDGGDWTAQRALVQSVQFRRHNLVSDPVLPGRFDAIFCRNVLFYFPVAVRGIVLERLAAALHPDGILVLGAGETVIGQTEAFRPSERYRGFYQPAIGADTLPKAVYNRG